MSDCMWLTESNGEERLPGPTVFWGRTHTDGLHHVWRMELWTGHFTLPLLTYTFLRVRRNTHRTAPDPKILRDRIDQTPWLTPNGNFWGSGAVFGVRYSRMNVVYFTPWLYRGGKDQSWVVGPYPLWDSVSRSPVHWGVWSIPSCNIFGSSVVRCGVSSDHISPPQKNVSFIIDNQNII